MPRTKMVEVVIAPRFIQLAVRPWSTDDGKESSSVVALGDDGIVYQYYHSEKAWIPYSSDILRRVS